MHTQCELFAHAQSKHTIGQTLDGPSPISNASTLFSVTETTPLTRHTFLGMRYYLCTMPLSCNAGPKAKRVDDPKLYAVVTRRRKFKMLDRMWNSIK